MHNNDRFRFEHHIGSALLKRKARLLASVFLLCLSIIVIAACNGPARARPTPLPPGTPLPQPTPIFSAPQQPSPTAIPADTLADTTTIAISTTPGEPEAEDATPEADAVTDLQALLLTRIAQESPENEGSTTATGASSPFTGMVGSSGALLYLAPGNYILKDVSGGSVVTVTGRSADNLWYAIYLESGEAGWIVATRIRLSGDERLLPVVDQSHSPEEMATSGDDSAAEILMPVSAPTTPTRLPAPQPQTGAALDSSEGDRAVVAVETLNVRAGPGTNYAVVSSLRQNQPVVLQARNPGGDWLQIQAENAPDGLGWIYAPLVTTAADVNLLPVAANIPTPPVIAAPAASTAVPAQQVQVAPAQGLQGTLVFQERSGGAIYRYNLQTGALHLLTYGADPAISPDGRTVAFVRHGGENGIYLINIDGSNERRIFGGNVPSSPKWHPDGNLILFSHIKGQQEPCRMTAMFGCIPQSEVDQLLQDFADMLPPDFTLDRWPLVEISLHNLSIIDVNGNAYRDLPSLSSVTAPDWGTWGIVYQSRGGLEITGMDEGATSRGLIQSHLFQNPAWQPGGERIIFQSREGNRWEIFIVNSDGAGLSPLTRPPLFASEQPHNVAPAWSPDGRWIVFLSNRSGKWALWVIDSGGGNLQQLPVDLPFGYQFGAEQVVSWGP
jgi:hypothetical protein